MHSRTKRSAQAPKTPAAREPSSSAEPPIPRPSPPTPNRRLLQASAILLLAWFGFLAWMAFFQ